MRLSNNHNNNHHHPWEHFCLELDLNKQSDFNLFVLLHPGLIFEITLSPEIQFYVIVILFERFGFVSTRKTQM